MRSRMRSSWRSRMRSRRRSRRRRSQHPVQMKQRVPAADQVDRQRNPQEVWDGVSWVCHPIQVDPQRNHILATAVVTHASSHALATAVVTHAGRSIVGLASLRAPSATSVAVSAVGTKATPNATSVTVTQTMGHQMRRHQQQQQQQQEQERRQQQL